MFKVGVGPGANWNELKIIRITEHKFSQKLYKRLLEIFSDALKTTDCHRRSLRMHDVLAKVLALQIMSKQHDEQNCLILASGCSRWLMAYADQIWCISFGCASIGLVDSFLLIQLLFGQQDESSMSRSLNNMPQWSKATPKQRVEL